MSRTTGQPHVGEEAPSIPDAWRIDFDGPIPPHRWPPSYKRWFAPVREIGRTYFDEYMNPPLARAPCTCRADEPPRLPVNLVPNEHNIAEKRSQVRDLNRRAFKCRRERRNEAGWRPEVEPPIFSRFETEAICKNCRNHIWQSDWQASPTDSVEATQLERQRARRAQCICDQSAREECDINDTGNTSMFIGKRETCLSRKAIGFVPSGIRRAIKPDLLYGLGMTNSFHVYTQRRRDIALHSPFKGAGEPCLYPFLVVEAKSEWNGPGFDSIERQLALPVRTCLRLQKDLELLSGVDVHPIVWSIAFRGDEWRLYAAVPNEERIRVIDLWHGNILSEDGALQIFLIVDYLCNWARDVFRTGVLKCLAGGADNLRRHTPAASQISSEDGQALSRRSVASLTVASQPRSTVDRVHVAALRTAGVEQMEIDEEPRMEMTNGSTTSSQTINTYIEDNSLQRTEDFGHPALGNASHIVRDCVQIRMPKTEEGLRQLLRTVLPHIEIQRAAQLILDNFVNDPYAITTDGESVLSSSIAQSLGFDDVERQEHERFRHYFTCKSNISPLHGITNNLLCVTCSQDSAVELAIIARADGVTVRAPRHWTITNINNVESAFRQLGAIGSRDLVMMALEAQTLQLATAVDDRNPVTVTWKVLEQPPALTRLFEGTTDGLSAEQMTAAFGETCVRRRLTVLVEEDRTISSGLRELTDVRSLENVPGILVLGQQRPLSEGTSSCFFLFDDHSAVEDAPGLLEATRQANAVYRQDTRGSWSRVSDTMEL